MLGLTCCELSLMSAGIVNRVSRCKEDVLSVFEANAKIKNSTAGYFASMLVINLTLPFDRLRTESCSSWNVQTDTGQRVRHR